MKTNYVAWSLYTGPSNVQPVINDKDCSWIVGTWDGVNANTTPSEIQKDIDDRIDILVKTLQKVLSQSPSQDVYFAIPEFFFHCKQGPYPNIKIGNTSVMEYIRNRLFDNLRKINFSNYYSVCTGSILTSNIEDYTTFLDSDPVKNRMNELNKVLAGKVDFKLKSAATSFPRLRSFGLETRQTNQANQTDTPLDNLNDLMKKYRADPLCTVRNRGIFFECFPGQIPQSYIYEKQYESTVDLTMGLFENNQITHGGMITEWVANYPSYSILRGDHHNDAYSTNARITSVNKVLNYGIEICLDHRLQRLRRTVGMLQKNGAEADNPPLNIQIIPSGGMQLLDYSIATEPGATPIFNADGCDKVYKIYGKEETALNGGAPGTYKEVACGVYAISIQSRWETSNDINTYYYSHSQLAFTTNSSTLDGYNNILELNNHKASTYDGSADKPNNNFLDKVETKVDPLKADTALFATGIGELHSYTCKS